MEQSNSGMVGHGMPADTISTKKITKRKQSKNKSNDVTAYKISENESLFSMVKTEQGIIICCSRYRVSNRYFKSYDEAEKFIASKPYELIINTTILINKFNNETEKESTKKSAKNA